MNQYSVVDKNTGIFAGQNLTWTDAVALQAKTQAKFPDGNFVIRDQRMQGQRVERRNPRIIKVVVR